MGKTQLGSSSARSIMESASGPRSPSDATLPPDTGSIPWSIVVATVASSTRGLCHPSYYERDNCTQLHPKGPHSTYLVQSTPLR